MPAATRSLLIFLILLLAGCGSPPRAAATTIQVSITSDGFTPSQWRVSANTQIQIQLINQTSDEHEWVLLKDPPKEPYGADEEAQVLVRIHVAAGQTLTSEFRTPAAPGEYGVTCSIPGHLEKGEAGKMLIVQPGY